MDIPTIKTFYRKKSLQAKSSNIILSDDNYQAISKFTSLSQTVISSLAPSQLPIPGSFSLILITLPPPQLFVHSLHSPHEDHSQPNTSPRNRLFQSIFCSQLSFLTTACFYLDFCSVYRWIYKVTLRTIILFTLLF